AASGCGRCRWRGASPTSSTLRASPVPRAGRGTVPGRDAPRYGNPPDPPLTAHSLSSWTDVIFLGGSVATAHAAQRRPAVLGDLLPGALVRDAALVLGAAAFVGVFAQIAVPLPGTPVPVTGQTFAVLLSGAALGF